MVKKLSTILFLLIAVTSLFADEQYRTIVVRDGKVVLDEGGPAGKRVFLGLAITSLTPDLREFFGAPKDSGVIVSSVVNESPVAKAGLRVGDVIVGVNGTPMRSYSDLLAAMKDKRAGDTIRIDIIRAKARQSIVATAEERELPEIRHAFDLGEVELELGTTIGGREWRARLATPETEELRARLRDLEKRLQELEKRLQQK
jgi:predicted metalloprotease with PDZ domain